MLHISGDEYCFGMPYAIYRLSREFMYTGSRGASIYTVFKDKFNNNIYKIKDVEV